MSDEAEYTAEARTSPKYQDAFDDLVAAIKKHQEHITPIEMLALTAKLTGRILALQDPAAIDCGSAMRTVMSNITLGNNEQVEENAELEEELMHPEGSA